LKSHFLRFSPWIGRPFVVAFSISISSRQKKKKAEAHENEKHFFSCSAMLVGT
jgi:hypothetical protein